jgi:HlyD family secretion protein
MKPLPALPRQFWLVLIGVLLLAGLAWVATRSGPLAPVRVTVAQVATGEVQPELFGIGVVEARRAYLVGPTTAGRVRRVLVDVGESVKAGQLLAEMDPVDLDARLAAADAAIARARSALASAAAQVSDAKSRQSLAAAEARRYRDLGNRGFVSSSAVETRVQQQQSADAQYVAAESALASARQDISRLEAERVAAGSLRSNIRLTAPVDGVVTSRDAEPGSTVVAGQAVLKLMDPASLWIRMRLDQSRSAGLRAGVPAAIILRSSPDAVLTGAVARVELVSDSVTEERIAAVAFNQPPPGLSIGEMAEVRLRLPAVRDVLLVPNAALRRRGADSGVWVLKDGGLRFAAVDIGAQGADGKVQVGGLKAGDEIIVYSERDLEEDSRIQVVESLQGNPQ